MRGKGFRYRHNFLFVVLIGFLLSFTNAVWAFLLSIAENANGNFVLVGLVMTLGLLPLPIALFTLKGEKFSFSAYPVLTGIFFGLANAILLSIFTYRNSAIIYSLISPTVIVFMIANVLVNNSKIRRGHASKLFLGASVAGLGFFMLSISSLQISLISGYDVAVSTVLVVLYGIASFLLTQTGLKSKSDYSAIMVIGAFSMVTILAFLPFRPGPFLPAGLPAAFAAGFIVSMGVVGSSAGYRTLQKSRHAVSYSSIMYILSEMETLLLLIFYSIFVGRLNFYVIGSVVLITIAIWYLSKESDVSFS